MGKRNVYRPVGIKNLAVDGKEYAGILDSSKIPADERFIHTYFRKFCLARSNQTDDDDNASVNSDDFDAAIQSSSKIDLDFASALEADDELEEEEENAHDSSSEGEEPEDSGSDFEEIDNFDNLSDEEIPTESEEENNASEQSPSIEKKFKGVAKSNKTESQKRGKRKASYDLTDLMASAEDYEQLIEDDIANDIDGLSGSVNEVSNKDKSNAKQLKWEAKRRNSESNKNRKMSKFKKNQN